MREGVDIDSFLQNGYWTNSRARTPDTRFPSQPYESPSVPRYSHSTEYSPELRRRSLYPPSPTAEDETESIAKEHGSVVSAYPKEEPQNAGEWDQNPIIEVLHEYNPERRFVFVPTSSPSADEARDELRRAARTKRSEDKNEKHSSIKDEDMYEENTCRQYVIVPPEGEEDKSKPNSGLEDREKQEDRAKREDREKRDGRPKRERRKSKLEELPAIVTDFEHLGRDDARLEDIRRSKSATGTEPGGDDYFSPRRGSQRLREESMLAPDVIKHSTKGRDRAYYDYSGATASNQGRNKLNQSDSAREKRYQRAPDDDSSRAYSAGPTDPRRHSEAPRNVRRTSKEGYTGYEKDYAGYDNKPRQYSDRPPKTGRTDSSSSISLPDREPLKPRSLSFRGKREPPPPYEDSRYSSEEESKHRPSPRRREKSFVHEERNGHLSTPSGPRPPGRRSKQNTPLASPRLSQGDLFSDPYDNNVPRSPRSATLPFNNDYPKPEQKNSAEEDLPSRPLSRASTAKSVLNNAAPIVTPIIAAATATLLGQDSGSPIERRSGAIPVPQKTRVLAGSRSSSSTLSSSPPKRPWQPPKFDPAKDGVQINKRTTSYRRFSEGIKDDLPDLPECPRTKPEAGHVDWLTLPKCNNFNICPSCYELGFGNTVWRNAFVPAPLRPLDRPLKCDLGASKWYHIAWLLTHKYQKPDLRLFQGLNNVTASHQPCSGSQQAVRIWYTIKDPMTQRPVRGFKTCHHCAKSIETLLPNLSGVFVPMDSPAEAKPGVCCMHQYGFLGRDRKRFLEYWDLMETASDLALAANRAPDIRALADKVREIALIDECYGSQPVAHRKWHTMRSLPSVTICEECFNEVIWPEIERDSSGIQAEFYNNPQKLEYAACQLYSERMRRCFQQAVQNDDLDYFRSRVIRRKQKEQEFYNKVRGLDPNVLGRERVDAEIERARRDWSRYE